MKNLSDTGAVAASEGTPSGPVDHEQQARERQRKWHEARAREHVGAAGWRQSTLLEEIIQAGREQFASTDALRQLVSLSAQALRTLPLSAQDSRQGQQRTLHELLSSGQEQLRLAHELETVIQRALGEIVDTPLPDLNARQLERVLGRVREQIGVLTVMIESARAQVGTLEQLQALDILSAGYQQQLSELRQLGAEEELEALVHVGEQVLERVHEVGVPGERQLETLGRLGEAAVKQVAETSASRDEQLSTLEGIQAEAQREAERLKEH